MSNPKKEETIQNIQQRLEASEAVLLADYRGLTASQMESLRGNISQSNATFHVLKNSLLKLALERAGYETPNEDLLDGPTAVLFSPNDPANAFKSVHEFSKENELPAIKGGYINKTLLAADKVVKIAKLPPINELHAKLLGQLNAPMSGLVQQLHGQVSQLVYVLNAIKEVKG